MKLYLGIDPGKTGAIAGLFEDEMVVRDMPIAGDEIDIPELAKHLKGFTTIYEVKACIEHAQVMPSQGSVSGYTIGKNFGIILGILGTLNIPFITVNPKKWQKEFAIIGKMKITKEMKKQMVQEEIDRQSDIDHLLKVVYAEKIVAKKIAKMRADIKSDIKEQGFVIAHRLFPDLELKIPDRICKNGKVIKGALKDGRVDAVLIAEYLKRVRE